MYTHTNVGYYQKHERTLSINCMVDPLLQLFIYRDFFIICRRSSSLQIVVGKLVCSLGILLLIVVYYVSTYVRLAKLFAFCGSFRNLYISNIQISKRATKGEQLCQIRTHFCVYISMSAVWLCLRFLVKIVHSFNEGIPDTCITKTLQMNSMDVEL